METFLIPIITPFHADGSVDCAGLADVVKRQMNRGARGFYVGGSSGECFLLSQDERKLVLETVLRAAEGRAYVVAHVGATGTDLAIDLARHAEQAGADALASVPPFYYLHAYENVERYYFDLAEATELSLIVYNVSLARFNFTIEQFKRLLAHDKIVALKYTDKDYYTMERVKKETNKIIYSGCDEMFLSALAAGADGAIGSTFNVMFDKYLAIYDSFRRGDVVTAQKIQQSANNVTQALIDCGSLMAGLKHILRLQGAAVEPISRRPFKTLLDGEMKTLEAVCRENGVL